jgi:hypothetical protein
LQETTAWMRSPLLAEQSLWWLTQHTQFDLFPNKYIASSVDHVKCIGVNADYITSVLIMHLGQLMTGTC